MSWTNGQESQAHEYHLELVSRDGEDYCRGKLLAAQKLAKWGVEMSGSRYPVSPANERTIDGIVFASKKEAHRYGELKLLERARIITELECQPTFEVYIKGVKLCRYTSDFRYRFTDCAEYIIEDIKTSGTAKDPYYRLRKKAAELFHGITITEVLS